MCNSYEQHVSYEDYVAAMRQQELATPATETAADLPRADDIRIGDRGPVLRAAGNGAELVSMRFGFPPPRPRAGPVFNFKSEGRHFGDSRRCVVVLSAFYEFTGMKYPKTKHRFALADGFPMGLAGLWSADPEGEPSFTLLTTAPGPDVAPYHDRQVCVLRPREWAAWLFLTRPEGELLRPLPAGSLSVATVRAGAE